MNQAVYINKLNAQLDEWNADLEKLEAKVRKATADEQLKYDRQMDAIRKRKNEAMQRLSEIRSASENTWELLKQRTDDAWSRLKDAVTDAKSEFK